METHHQHPHHDHDAQTSHVVPTKARKRWPLNRWQTIVALIIVILLGAVSYSVYGYSHQVHLAVASPTPIPTLKPSQQPTATPTPALVPNLLTGVMVQHGKENLHPLAVMIENHPDARPQYGLSQADLVVEAIAEGGITRFMAIFADPTKEVRVGPVRSARTYYVDFATEINAFYAHVGGSEPALAQIKQTGVLDLDQSGIGEPTYKRDFSRNVALEHTMFSSTDKLWNYATQTRKWSTTQDFQPWLFQDDAAIASRPATQTITVSFSSDQYKTVWSYNPTSNAYSRTMAGKPHIDPATNRQITAKNIVLETVGRSSVTESNGKVVWDYHLTGSGKAVVIQNGVAIQGTWKKDGTNRTRYYDSTGKEIQFVRGNTWIDLVHEDTAISY